MITRSSYVRRAFGDLRGLVGAPGTSISMLSHIHSGGSSSRLHLKTALRSTPVSFATPLIVPPASSPLRTARQSSIEYLQHPIAPLLLPWCNDR